MPPSTREKIIYICCIVAAVLVGYFAPRNIVCGVIATGLSYVGVFFHEIGHALFNWLYGYMAVPTFDFASGGGMTYQFGDRSWLLQGVVWLVLAGLVVLARRRAPPLMLPLAALAAFVFGTSLLDAHQFIIVFMGHGTEVLLAAFLLCRGYYNVWLSRAGERWVNVFIGAYMLGAVITLMWALMHNPGFAMEYEAQKGGHRFGDINRLEDESGASMMVIGWSYIAFALASVAAIKAWVAYHLRSE